jgi:DNA-binding MarR family transcriptional regulator
MDHSLGRLLGRICRLNRRMMHTLWDELGLYRGQPFLLGVLWEQEGITHSELAQRMQVSPATVTNMLKRMEKAGFVERRPDAEDQRVSRVYLTDAGREIRGRVDQHWQGVEARVFGTFSEQEQETLRELLTRVQQELVRLHEARSAEPGPPPL